MKFGKIAQRLLVYLCLGTAAFAQTGPVLFSLPGSGTNQSHLVAYPGNSSALTPLLDTSGPTNASQVIPIPQSGKFYVVSDGGVQLLNLSAGTFQAVNGIAGAVTSARITPDGNYLMVIGDNFSTVDINTNTVVATNVGAIGYQVTDVAFSADSSKMYVLREQLFAYSLIAVDLTNFQAGDPVSTNLAGTALTMSPLGVLYLSSQGAIGEFDPMTLDLVTTIPITGLPGPLRFVPDGTRAYFANLTPGLSGKSIQTFRTQQRDVSGWPLLNNGTVPSFDDVLVASADQIYALDRGATTLWRITPSPLGGSIATFPSVLDPTQVYSAVLSGEIPASALFVVGNYNGQTALRKISLVDGSLAAQTGVTGVNGLLAYAPAAPQFGASNIVKFGDMQTVPLTGGTVRIAVRLTDPLNQPVYNHPVNFATGNSGVTLSNTSTRTGSNGIAETYVSLPGQPATYNVSIIAASISDSFQLTVTDGTNTGGGGSGSGGDGSSGVGTMTAIAGDGMLVGELEQSAVPLTVEVRDASGNLKENVPVSFTVTDGVIGIDSSTVTNAQGIAALPVFGGPVLGTPYTTALVQVHSDYGDVDFHITVFDVDTNKVDAIQVDNPSVFAISGARGATVQGAFAAHITTRDGGDGIPNVSLRAASASDPTLPGPGVCANNPLSDSTGLVSCDLKISCSATASQDVLMVIGENRWARGTVYASGAAGGKIAVVSGNNQTGNAGAVLNRLVAVVTDGCGQPAGGQDVVWTVTQGSATLSQVISRSGNDGLVSAGVSLGNTAGTVKVRVSLANATPLDFTLTANVVIGSVVLMNGGGQSAVLNGAFTNPVVFSVKDNNGKAVGSGITVAFTADNGASLGAASASTDNQGLVQTTVTAGGQSGTITVTASVAGQSATAKLTVSPPTLPISASSFTNAASRMAGLVPCGLVTVTGNGLASNPGVASGVNGFGPLPYNLAGVSISINGVPAPIQAVANVNGVQTVNFQAPCETQPGVATAVIKVNDTPTTINNINVFAAQPGVFTYAGPDNQAYGAVIRVKDGSYITPSNPAPTGEDYLLILTGLGQDSSNSLKTNTSGLNQELAISTIVGVNDAGVPSQAPHYLFGNPGVYYIPFTIPRQPGVATGTILRDVHLGVFAVINGQAVVGNSPLLPALLQQ